MNSKNKIPDLVAFPMVTALLGIVFMVLPLVGPLILLPFMGFVNLYDSIIPGDFTRTGEHVEIGFAWMVPLTVYAYFFYGSFFALIGVIVAILTSFTQKLSFVRNRKGSIVLAIMVLYVVSIPLAILASYIQPI